MRTPVFTGSCPALVTPFDQNGNIDYDAFGQQIDYQLAAGVDAVCGSISPPWTTASSGWTTR